MPGWRGCGWATLPGIVGPGLYRHIWSVPITAGEGLLVCRQLPRAAGGDEPLRVDHPDCLRTGWSAYGQHMVSNLSA